MNVIEIVFLSIIDNPNKINGYRYTKNCLVIIIIIKIFINQYHMAYNKFNSNKFLLYFINIILHLNDLQVSVNEYFLRICFGIYQMYNHNF